MSSNPEGDEDDEGGDEDPEYAAERAALQNQMNTLSEDIDGITSTSAPQENPYDMVSDSNVPYELAGEQGAVGDAGCYLLKKKDCCRGSFRKER